VSAAAFRRWLADRYGSVEGLNDAWSTRFWAQGYGSFEEVLPPRSPAPFANPAQDLDYARFTSDELLACYLAEKQVLDRITPGVPATTNFPPSLRPVDLWTWAPHVDVVGYDAYPDPADADAAAKVAFSYDVMRSLRAGQPWLLMEQAPGAVNWRPHNAAKPPATMRLWSRQAVAHGADAVMFSCRTST
jgi:beta-galactosidase